MLDCALFSLPVVCFLVGDFDNRFRVLGFDIADADLGHGESAPVESCDCARPLLTGILELGEGAFPAGEALRKTLRVPESGGVG